MQCAKTSSFWAVRAPELAVGAAGCGPPPHAAASSATPARAAASTHPPAVAGDAVHHAVHRETILTPNTRTFSGSSIGGRCWITARIACEFGVNRPAAAAGGRSYQTRRPLTATPGAGMTGWPSGQGRRGQWLTRRQACLPAVGTAGGRAGGTGNADPVPTSPRRHRQAAPQASTGEDSATHSPASRAELADLRSHGATRAGLDRSEYSAIASTCPVSGAVVRVPGRDMV